MNAMTLDKAIAVAVEGHEGQVDGNGEPMILHVLRVMLAVGPGNRIAAVLHDVCEDTKFTLDDLRAGGLSDRDAEIVDALTHRKGERYFTYIRRAGRTWAARAVKMKDIEDNQRYEKGLRMLAELADNDNDTETDNAKS